MNWKTHFDLKGKHAFLSPSQSSWLRYDDEKTIDVFNNLKAKEHGTIMHAWAEETINLNRKQPRNHDTLNMYINDAIGFKMSTEVQLVYSEYCFGTADAICFRNGMLRIHDLKTGKSGKAEDHFEQLLIYAALFCLEYGYKPSEIKIELRVYKNNEVKVLEPLGEDVAEIMSIIKTKDQVIRNYLQGMM